jgi:hypothetical protein
MTTLVERIIDGSKKYVELAAASSEIASLPTAGICTGSTCAVADSGKVLMFDEVSGEWNTFAVFNTEEDSGGGIDISGGK